MATKSTQKTYRHTTQGRSLAAGKAKEGRTGHVGIKKRPKRAKGLHAMTAHLPDGTVVVRFSPNKKPLSKPLLYGQGGESIRLQHASVRELKHLIPEKYSSFIKSIERGGLVAEPDETPQIDPMAEIESAEELPIRERDMSDVEAELHSALTPKEMVGRMGLTRAAISNQRNAGKILGLPKGNRYVFPSWQLDKSGQPHAILKQILDTLKSVSEDPTNLLIYMTTGLDFYQGKSIKDYLIAGDTESALSVARTIAKI